jgi:hypothetical protein
MFQRSLKTPKWRSWSSTEERGRTELWRFATPKLMEPTALMPRLKSKEAPSAQCRFYRQDFAAAPVGFGGSARSSSYRCRHEKE